MPSDYEIKFRFACKHDSAALDQLLSEFIERVERAHAFTGGGCDSRGGEFYIEAGAHVTPKDVLAMIAVWLPHTSQLSVKTIDVEDPALSAPKVSRKASLVRSKHNGARTRTRHRTA